MKTKPIVTSRGSFSFKRLAIATSCTGALLAFAPVQAANYSGVGDWEEVANWTGVVSASGIPGSTDNVDITGGASVIAMDAGTWQYFVDNSLLTAGSSGEYRTARLRLAGIGTATLNVDIGDGHVWRNTATDLQFVGSGSGSDGTLNIYSGDIRIESSSLRIAEKAGSTGLINISGGANTRLIASRETGGISMQVGTGGAGTFQIDGGKFRSRAGVQVGSFGIFSVLGSAVTEVEIGSEGTLDGNWTQNAGGILKIGIDSGGVTKINVADKDTLGGTYATFDAGSLLDLSFLNGTMLGTWSVMEVQNAAITDNGLQLAPGTDSGWSFNIDNSGANGLLTVTYVPEPSAFALAGVGIAGLLIFRRRA